MYDRLEITEFGKQLIVTGDLDPLYIALHNSGFKRDEMYRWLVAYWCYYHAGLACKLAERKDYFEALMEVAQGGTNFPRGTERRHFRGKLAVDSIKALSKKFNNAKEIVNWLIRGGPTAKGISKKVKELHGFGNWISWKVPDMIERLGLAPVEFEAADITWMFKSSLQGAEETFERYNLKGKTLFAAHNFLIRQLGDLKAPPRYERLINVQETETVFCKWHSHLGGHYPLGKDTREIAEGLHQTIKGNIPQKLARRLLEGLGGPRNG